MKQYLGLFSLLMILFSATGCEKAAFIDESDDPTAQPTNSGKAYKVNVVTRSTSSDISYPISIYAYDAAGNIAAQQTINSSSEKLNLQLTSGTYLITAISGSQDFSAGYATTPLMVGHSDVTISESAATVNILLSYAVASLKVTMTNIPSDVTAVTLLLSDQYTSVTSSGTYSGSGKSTIPCSRLSDGSWTTGKVYVLPGCGTNTVMTLSLTSSAGTEVFGITYSEPLKAAVPYAFTGTYSGDASGVKVTGTLSYGEWGTEVNKSFTFGPNASNAFDGNTSSQTINVTALPQQGSVWNGHVVAYIDGSDALLISLSEWENMTSAYYENDPYIAKEIASDYKESDLTSWTIPTSDQARLLRTAWKGSLLDGLNDAIRTAGGKALSLTDDDGKNVRYLCEDATYTFSFADSGSLSQAGKTVKTYRLRLVKAVTFVVQ